MLRQPTEKGSDNDGVHEMRHEVIERAVAFRKQVDDDDSDDNVDDNDDVAVDIVVTVQGDTTISQEVMLRGSSETTDVPVEISGLTRYGSLVSDTTEQDSTELDALDSAGGNAQDSVTQDSSVQDDEVVEPELPWSLQIGTTVSTQKQRSGVDLSGSQATVDGNVRLRHSIGAYVQASGTRRLGAGGIFQQSSLTGGYVYALSSSLDLSAEVTKYSYADSDVNALAQSPLSASLSLDWAGDEWDAGLNLERFSGTNSFTYLTASTGRTFFAGTNDDYLIAPSLSLTLTSSSYQRKNRPGTIRTRLQLSSILLDVYAQTELGYGFDLFVDPTLLVSFQKDLLKVLTGASNAVSRSAQFIFVAGVRYTYKF